MDTLMGNFGRISLVSALDTHYWGFNFAVKNRKGENSLLLNVDWPERGLEKMFIESAIPRVQRHLSSGFILAYDETTKTFFPKNSQFTSPLRELQKSLEQTSSTMKVKIRCRGKLYLVTGARSQEMLDTTMFMVIPERSITDEIRELRTRLRLFALLSLAMSLYLGLILSRRFLDPITDLTRGISAIQARDFDFRVPAREKDELGDLAFFFNRTMEGLSQLEIARIVQESLFPAESVSSSRFRLSGLSLPANELGGDYFDLQLFPDGRILIVIGDISGHGVPAALGVAMVKALVADSLADKSFSVPILLGRINRCLIHTLKREFTFTAVIGILDPESDTLIYENVGHPTPYLFRLGSPLRPLAGNSPPLGLLDELDSTPIEIRMQAGDTIFFYTDGIFEARIGNKRLGLDHVLAHVCRALPDEPESSCREVLAWHCQLTGRPRPEDDVTVIFLHRRE